MRRIAVLLLLVMACSGKSKKGATAGSGSQAVYAKKTSVSWDRGDQCVPAAHRRDRQADELSARHLSRRMQGDEARARDEAMTAYRAPASSSTRCEWRGDHRLEGQRHRSDGARGGDARRGSRRLGGDRRAIMAELPDDLIGQVIEGRFEIRAKLGQAAWVRCTARGRSRSIARSRSS